MNPGAGKSGFAAGNALGSSRCGSQFEPLPRLLPRGGHGKTVKGFTLVEVLVALAIAAVGLAATFGAVNQAAFNTYYLREQTLANWVAANKIAEIRVAPELPDYEEADGEMEMAGRIWRWSVTVNPTPAENLIRIDVEVTTDDDPDQVLSTMAGFMGLPRGQGGAVLRWEGQAGGGDRRGIR